MKRFQRSLYPYEEPEGIVPVSRGLPRGAPSSRTNSNDPNSKDSRLFVGNLNTVLLSKEDVEAIFNPYGHVTAISLHKGFAFVQYLNPDAARWAGACEDGRTYAGQVLDINVVSQPKNRSGLKRSTSGNANNDSAKKTRQDTSDISPFFPQSFVTDAKTSDSGAYNINQTSQRPFNGSYKDSKPDSDIMICGVCKTQFESAGGFVQHKKFPCQAAARCRCQEQSGADHPIPLVIECASCGKNFNSIWALCVHCQQEHLMSIYRAKNE